MFIISEAKKSKINVVIADDSEYLRKIISNILLEHDSIKIINEAKNGLEAVEMVQENSPDVLVLDLLMPEMNGLDAFRKIMEISPIPTIILSAVNPQDMDASVQALLLGAFDYVIKPGGLGAKDLPRFREELLSKVILASQSQIKRIYSEESALNKDLYIRQELVDEAFQFGQYLKGVKSIRESDNKVSLLLKDKEKATETLENKLEQQDIKEKAILKSTSNEIRIKKVLKNKLKQKQIKEKTIFESRSDEIEIKEEIPRKTDVLETNRLKIKKQEAIKKSEISPIKGIRLKSNVIVIGASVGGPKTLKTLLKDIPSSIPCPILIVQHLSDPFIDPFVKSLKSFCEIGLKIAVNGEMIQPGTAYFAPSGKHMEIIVVDNQPKIHIFEGIPVNFCIPSIDVLFVSASRVYKNKTLGILLTGMGSDGVDGLEAIKSLGGKTIAESQETCILYGMSKNAIDRKLADLILPNYNIANHIIQFANIKL